jgi:hypothetical protein
VPLKQQTGKESFPKDLAEKQFKSLKLWQLNPFSQELFCMQ